MIRNLLVITKSDTMIRRCLILKFKRTTHSRINASYISFITDTRYVALNYGRIDMRRGIENEE